MMVLTCNSDVRIRQGTAKSVIKSKERLTTRVCFEFPDHGEVVHPTMTVEVLIGTDWQVLSEIDLLKTDLQCVLDICNRMEKS